MKPLSVEMACLLGIQNEIQAVWFVLIGKTIIVHFLFDDMMLLQNFIRVRALEIPQCAVSRSEHSFMEKLKF